MELLVTPAWLSSRINDPEVVALDATLPPVGVSPPVDTQARYRAEHIPGALFFDIEALSDHATALPHMLPDAESFARSMAAVGVGDRMTIVVYEQQGVFSAPRAWWMLRTFGARKVAVLDGGLQGWIDGRLPVSAEPVVRKPATFDARLDREAVRDFGQVLAMLASPAARQILDARSAGRFAGTAPEPRPGLPSGHMPGTTGIPFTDLLEAGRLKTSEALRELFLARGVDLDQPVTTTCGSGVTAAVLALGLELAGARSVSLYDGSWAEYAQQPGAAIDPAV
jgi:thiosulfate/3-mercaptopyruvate sulfurtransferase